MATKRPTIDTKALDLLAAAKLDTPATAVQFVPLSTLQPLPFQPRTYFNQSKLEELAESIRQKGVLQPLLVRQGPAGKYEIIAGERRWRAAQLAGLQEVPVFTRDMDDETAKAAMLIENLQREDLTTLEEVDAKLDLVALTFKLPSRRAAYDLLLLRLREPDKEQEDALNSIFLTLGESWRSFAKNKIRILNWPEPILAAMREHGLHYTHAGVVVGAPPEHQAELLKLALSGMSRSELRTAVYRLKQQARTHLDNDEITVVARTLGSRVWLKSLTPRESQEIAAWLKTMPSALQRGLKLKQPTKQETA